MPGQTPSTSIPTNEGSIPPKSSSQIPEPQLFGIVICVGRKNVLRFCNLSRTLFNLVRHTRAQQTAGNWKSQKVFTYPVATSDCPFENASTSRLECILLSSGCLPRQPTLNQGMVFECQHLN